VNTALIEYFQECEEILARVWDLLSQIEKNGVEQESIDSLYRDIHTLKGSSQLFGFKNIGSLAHAIEAVLEPIRNRKRPLDPILFQQVWKTLGVLDGLLKSVKSIGSETDNDREPAFTSVCALIDVANRVFRLDYQTTRDTLASADDSATPASSEQSAPEGDKVESVELQPIPEIVPVVFPQPVSAPSDGAHTESSTVRVQVSLLDRLMNLVGEMVLVRNQVLQHATRSDDYGFTLLSQKLDAVTSELQDEVMKTRMQPIGTVLSQLQRLVRDLAKDMDKQIELVVEGADTDLDKTLIEAIKDPLTHVVRNSCDHGIESPTERIKKGKPALGKVWIRAFQENGYVSVQVQDNGRGLNIQKIKAKALEKGMITPERAQQMTDAEVHSLIFAAGFSTADQISSVSGRGVGMDVVKTNLEKIGGKVQVASVSEQGSSIQLQIPLTLAIVPALLIESAGDLFCIPQLKLVELVRHEQNTDSLRLENIAGTPVLRLRGQILPLLTLSDILGRKPVASPSQDGAANIVILSNEGRTFGMIVDRILDTADIVVKPLAKFFQSLELYAGATILGDGRVALIFDVGRLSERAHLIPGEKNPITAAVSSGAKEDEGRKFELEDQDYLSFQLDDGQKYVLPLGLVQRLEEFPSEEIEIAGLRPVVQYRGSVLPLVSIAGFLGLENKPLSGRSVPSIVVQKRNRLFGLAVDRILDVMSSNSTIEDAIPERRGIAGHLVVGDNVLTVLDAFAVLDKEFGASTDKAGLQMEKPAARPLKILFAEDTKFFANQVMRLLTAEGHTVTHARDGLAAWEALQAPGPKFDLLISDIEMPRMNGYELMENVRSLPSARDLPAIALTTRFRDSDVKRGKEVGFDYYLEKLKADELLASMLDAIKGRAS